jgi:FAD/FMN-containing dehydrogenase
MMRLDELQRRAKEITTAVIPVSDDIVAIAPWKAEEVPRIIEHCLSCEAPLVVGNGVLSAGVRFDFSKLQKIKPDETSLVVHVEAGVKLGQLEKKLHTYNLTLGPIPGELREHSVGGAIAGRSYFKLGRYFSYWEDPLLSLDVILPNGNYYHTTPSPRRASGPDLTKLLAGSEGTLGIIMSARLRVYTRTRSAREAVWHLPTLQAAGLAARKLLRAGLCCSVLYAEEHPGKALLGARLEGSMASLHDARLQEAEALLGPTQQDPHEVIQRFSTPQKSLPTPRAEIFVPYEEVSAVLALCPERSAATLTAKLPEVALLSLENVSPVKLFMLARAHRGTVSPASALYEAGTQFGASTLGAAYASLQAMKQVLDPKHLFAKGALGL